MTPRQTRFAQVLEWIADAGPEDLADLRREIETETQEFQLAKEEHRIHLAGLRRLESILAERCGEVVDTPAVITAGIDVGCNGKVTTLVDASARHQRKRAEAVLAWTSGLSPAEAAEMVGLSFSEHFEQAAVANDATNPPQVQPVHEPVAAIDAEPNPAEAPSQTALDTFLGKVARWESTEPITPSENSVDEREPPPDEDDDRSVEDRIRDLLAKVGERSARQIGAQIGIEKSVVLEMLESSRLFLKVKSADYDDLPAVNRPWKLSKAGRG